MGTKEQRRRAAAGGFAVGALVAAAAVAGGNDWTQWRGPARNGVASDFQAPEEWPDELEVVWRVELGDGHSSPLVAGDRVYVFVRTENGERLEARSFESGELLWETEERGVEYEPFAPARDHGKGPFSTPTLADGKVVTLGITGQLSAFSAEDGALLWRRSSAELFDKPRPFYGHASSPLVVGKTVIAALGGPKAGALVALGLDDGEELWRFGDDGPSYGSPMLLDGGTVGVLSESRFVAVSLATGELAWELPLRVSSMTPVLAGDRLLVGGDKIEFQSFDLSAAPPAVAWSNSDVRISMSSPVPWSSATDQELVFAFTSRNKGQLLAIDLATGDTSWRGDPRSGENAFLTVAQDRLMAAYADGTFDVWDLSGAEPERMQRYTLSEHEIWAQPAFVGDSMVIKARTELTRFRLRPSP